ncbi:MAG: hypothetical protein CMF46_05065 [Legionellales bacterium]|nr:hypothetical protein [Legionellales bacterium]
MNVIHAFCTTDNRVVETSYQQLSDYFSPQDADDCSFSLMIKQFLFDELPVKNTISYSINSELAGFFSQHILAKPYSHYIYNSSNVDVLYHSGVPYFVYTKQLSRKSVRYCLFFPIAIVSKQFSTTYNLLDSIPINAWWIDDTGTILYHNNSMRATVKKNIDFNSSAPISYYDILSDTSTDVEQMLMNDLSVLSAKNTQYFEEFSELDDRKSAWLSTKKYYHCGVTNINGIVGISYDITKHKKNEKEVEVLKSKLTTDLEKTESLIVDLRHDFKSPLANIITIVEYLKNEYADNQSEELLDSINHCCQQLLMMLDDIMEKTKYQSLEKLSIDKIYTHELYANIKSYLVIMTIDSSLKCAVSLSDDVPSVIYSSQTRIERIINNLINNSAKFTTSGSIDVLIDHEFDSVSNKSFLKLDVVDTGIGISKKSIQSNFDKYQTNDAAKRGDGIGLSIVRSYVDQLNGTIKVSSQKNKGTRVSIKLPIIAITTN